MAGEARVTTDRDEIRRWVEARGGYPATVVGTEQGGEGAGLLRIDYPGFSGEGRLERISWEEFFDKFERERLAFLYQDESTEGGETRFSKLIDRDSAAAREVSESETGGAITRARRPRTVAATTRKTSPRGRATRATSRSTSTRGRSTSAKSRKASGGRGTSRQARSSTGKRGGSRRSR